MKKVLLFVAIVMYSSGVFAQVSSASFTLLTGSHQNLDADQNKVLTYVGSLPREGTVKHIDWNASGLTGNSISISLPDENNGQPIAFDVLDVFFASVTQYAIFGKSSAGNIAIYITPEGTGGTIDLVGSSYNLYPLGSNKGLLIKNSSVEALTSVCGTQDNNPEETSDELFCGEECGKAVLDILAMVTPNAQVWLNDNFGSLAPWFLFVETHNINGAFIFSGIPDKRVHVRTINYTPNFALTTDILTDLLNFRSNSDAQYYAQQYGADIRVLLYLTPLGFVHEGIVEN